MGVTRGSIYPCIEDGLIWSWDPKNRNCWDGGTDGKGYPVDWTNRASGTANIVLTNTGPGFTDGAMESEGYFHFDGTDDVLNITDTFNDLYGDTTGYPYTVSVWCKADTVSTRAFIIGSMGSGWGAGVMMVRFEDGGASVGGNDTAVFTMDAWNANMCSGSVTFTDWNNIVGTVDSSRNCKIYVNGVAGSTATSDAPALIYNFSIGNSTNPSDGRDFDGKIGPCMIYNRELTAGEVLTNYNRLKGRFGL